MSNDRRFIEESFPVKDVGAISAKEKSIRHGNISTLHIWWARRPLAASRGSADVCTTVLEATLTVAEASRKGDLLLGGACPELVLSISKCLRSPEPAMH